MSQLVGRACAICNERISAVLGAAWCGACGAPVHERCRRAGTAGGCTECGADEAVAAAHRKRREEEAAATWRGIRSERVGWGLWHLISGLVLLAIGIGSYVIPMLDQYRGLFVVWTGAIFVGWIQLLRGIVELIRAARRKSHHRPSSNEPFA